MIKFGINPTLAEVGKIKTGFKGPVIKSKKGNPFQPPKKIDHFIITTTVRDKETGNLVQDTDLMKKLPADSNGEIKEIKIRLPFDSIDKNFFTQYQAYESRKCFCRGDGEKASRKDKDGKVTDIVCNPEKCEFFQKGKCKVSGILSAFIPESGVFGGVYKLRTHSYNAVASILGALQYISENAGGILQGIPLKLVLLKKTTEEHGDVIYPTVVLDLTEMQGLRTIAIAEKENRKAIGFNMKETEEEAVKSGFFKETDTEEDIAEEFYPEEQKDEPPKKSCSADELKDIVNQAAQNDQPEEEKKVDPIKVAPKPAVEKSAPPQEEPKTTIGQPTQLDIF